MTVQELLDRGFKKKGGKTSDYWFEKKQGIHTFITNDDLYNKGQDVWHVGYYNSQDGAENIVWFGAAINTSMKFDLLFMSITEKLPSVKTVLRKN